MTYGLMADIHLHVWTAFASTDMNGVNTRLSGLLDEIKRCAKDVADHGGDTIIMAGDVFHVRGSVNPVVLNSLKDTLAECHEKHGVYFVIIPGNHDLAGRDSERLGSAVTALECGYVDVSAQTLTLPGTKAILVPWHEKVDDLKQEILRVRDELEASTNDGTVETFDLVIHAPIDGVLQGLPAHGLTPDWLAQTGFRRVFSGHYHQHKRFPAGVGDRTEVWSIGALGHLTWSDVGTKAGYLLVDHDKVTWRKSHLPQFVDLAQLTTIEPEEIPLVVDGNYVRVRVEADKSKEVAAAQKELMDMGALAVLVQAMPVAPVRTGATPATVTAGASLEVSVADFIKASTTLKQPDAVSVAAMDVLASVTVD